MGTLVWWDSVHFMASISLKFGYFLIVGELYHQYCSTDHTVYYLIPERQKTSRSSKFSLSPFSFYPPPPPRSSLFLPYQSLRLSLLPFKSERGSGDIGKWDGRMFKLELVFISCLISWRLSPWLSAANPSDLSEAHRLKQRTNYTHTHTHAYTHTLSHKHIFNLKHKHMHPLTTDSLY